MIDQPNPTQGGTEPLLVWVLRQHPDTPKTRAKQWILAGRVSVGGVVLRKPHERIPDPGDTLRLLDRQANSVECGPGWQIHPRVTLLFLDKFIVVVNKGPGLISIPAPNTDLSALSIVRDFLAGRLKPKDRAVGRSTLPAAYRDSEPLPVHRLDQYTSGVFCMAMNPTARQQLIAQLNSRVMKREYVAFVEGRLKKSQGVWQHWLALTDDQMHQTVIGPKTAPAQSTAQEAITHYEVIAEYQLPNEKGCVSKLKLRLETGRKHQIRVQAAYTGTPVIGDRTYNPHYRNPARSEGPIPFSRQALHAESLTVEHPERPGRPMTFTAALPQDLRELESTLRWGQTQSAGA